MKKDYCIIIHYHEIALKGNNRSWFEKQLIKNIKNQLNGLAYRKVHLTAARIFCFGINPLEWENYANRLNKVMGIKHATFVIQVLDDIEIIQKTAVTLLKEIDFSSFRVSARRQYKNFHLTSQQVNELVGKSIQSIYLKPVNLKNADINIIIELVKGMAYIGFKRVFGFGGLPIKTGEKAISLISSGIDSPVASFQMLKRGVDLTYVHFHSAPATSHQSIQNVKEILTVLSGYQISCVLYIMPLLEIQQKIMSKAPNKLWVILFRRSMMKLASILAEKINAPAIISGESVGQVASQTLSNIRATSESISLPIIRPLAGSNKEEIIHLAEKIGTYKISIEPYDDCCSFFVPIHPETKANVNFVKKIENDLELESLYNIALNNSEKNEIKHPDYENNNIKKMENIND